MAAPPVPPQAPPKVEPRPKVQAPVAPAPDATIEAPRARPPKVSAEDAPDATVELPRAQPPEVSAEEAPAATTETPPARPAAAPQPPRTQEPVTRPSIEPVATERPGRPAAPRAPINPFLSKDPRQKARRLARALVSDMIVYQPEKRQQALAAGTLKEAFAEEIRKSWEEYVEQVGKEMADSTSFFTDALNEILAGGQQIF